MNDLIRRQRALDKTINRFRGRAFVWGKADCVVMARAHLVAMGHKGLPKRPRYKSALGAKRAIKAQGHATLTEMFDAHLPRIKPSEALPGDILVSLGTEGLEAVFVNAGYKIGGWHQDAEGFVFITPAMLTGAWRA